MVVAVVILFPFFVIVIFCASLTTCSFKLSTIHSTGVQFTAPDDTFDGIECSMGGYFNWYIH